MRDKAEVNNKCSQCRPHRCPICGGKGSVPSTTRSVNNEGRSYQKDETEICGGCCGAKIVWPPCSMSLDK